jgi:hypothetical protein
MIRLMRTPTAPADSRSATEVFNMPSSGVMVCDTLKAVFT